MLVLGHSYCSQPKELCKWEEDASSAAWDPWHPVKLRSKQKKNPKQWIRFYFLMFYQESW